MDVKLAEHAGFCFGVKRAVDMVYKQLEENPGVPIYTYGPIIHNDEVVKDMQAKGVVVINNLDDLSYHEKGIIIIRSHGISKAEYDKIKDSGFEIKDATCPFVKKIHNLVEEHSVKNEYIIIVGNPDHPEVKGIRGWVVGNDVSVINSIDDARGINVPKDRKICIVSQTTFNLNKFQELVEIVREKGYNISVLNTICNATEERQTEARNLAEKSDVMIVIGDKNSSNTQKLFEICKNECVNTYYIQTSKDMDYSQIGTVDTVGITAGASTPNNIIEEVSKNVRNEL